MRKTMKRLLAMIMAVSIVMGTMNLSAWAAEDVAGEQGNASAVYQNGPDTGVIDDVVVTETPETTESPVAESPAVAEPPVAKEVSEAGVMLLNEEPEPQNVYVYLKAPTGAAEALGFKLNGNQNDNTWCTVGKLAGITVKGLDAPTSYPKINGSGNEPVYLGDPILANVVALLNSASFEVFGTNADAVGKIDLINGVDWSAAEMGLHTSDGANDYRDEYTSGDNTWHLDGTLKTFTVTYENGLEGSAAQTETYDGLVYGADAPEAPAFTRDGYTLKGWDKEITKVTGDVTYTAQWAVPVYVYLVLPDGYNAEGWSTNGNGNWCTVGKLEVSDLDPATNYPSIKDNYDPQWLDEDQCKSVVNQLGGLDKWAANKAVVEGIDLIHGVDWTTGEMGLHTSKGADSYVTTDMSNTWHLDGTLKTFTVTYLDGANGSVFAEQTSHGLLYNADTPAAPTTLTREGYTFKGWDKKIDDKVTENVTYTAQWEKIPETVTVYVYVKSLALVEGWTANGDSKDGVYWHTAGSIKVPADTLPAASTYDPAYGEDGKITYAEVAQRDAVIGMLDQMAVYGTNGEALNSIAGLPIDWTTLGLHTSNGAEDYVDISRNEWHLDGLLTVGYTVEWYDAHTGEQIEGKTPEARSAGFGSKVSVTEADKVVEGYSFVADDGRNITSIQLKLTVNKNAQNENAGSENVLKLYFEKIPEPTETPEPSESPKPTESTEPSESPEPTESTEPSESPEPAESSEPTGRPEPDETPEPTRTPAPAGADEASEPFEELMIEDLDEVAVPLADLPKDPEEFEELADEDVPLASVPETGDAMLAWASAAALSGLGLVFLSRKKKEETN